MARGVCACSGEGVGKTENCESSAPSMLKPVCSAFDESSFQGPMGLASVQLMGGHWLSVGNETGLSVGRLHFTDSR